MEDWLRDVIFDDAGNVWVLGYTESTDISLHNAIQETYGGQGDVLIARFSPQHELEFCTYFGGDGTDYGMAFTLDSEGNVIIAGSTQSSDFYTLNALQTELNGTSDVFVTKISPSGIVNCILIRQQLILEPLMMCAGCLSHWIAQGIQQRRLIR